MFYCSGRISFVRSIVTKMREAEISQRASKISTRIVSCAHQTFVTTKCFFATTSWPIEFVVFVWRLMIVCVAAAHYESRNSWKWCKILETQLMMLMKIQQGLSPMQFQISFVNWQLTRNMHYKCWLNFLSDSSEISWRHWQCISVFLFQVDHRQRQESFSDGMESKQSFEAIHSETFWEGIRAIGEFRPG